MNPATLTNTVTAFPAESDVQAFAAAHLSGIDGVYPFAGLRHDDVPVIFVAMAAGKNITLVDHFGSWPVEKDFILPGATVPLG